MSHTIRTRKKLLNRVSRIRGQLVEVMEDHIRSHLVEKDRESNTLGLDAVDQLIDVIHSYIK